MGVFFTEDAFLEKLTAADPDASGLIRELEGLARAGAITQAESFAQLLEDACAERGRTDDALAALQARASWRESVPVTAREHFRERALTLLGGDRARRSLVDHAGFDKPIPLPEAIRRLRILLQLREGLLCHDRTWGAGIIRRMDPLYGRIGIDFENRPGHQMSYAYAAETLTILPPEHLLARFLTDTDALRRTARENPGEIVEWALRDFGPLTADQIRERLSPRLVAESDWKTFWDAARKALKNHPRVRAPSRRSEPFTLHAEGERYSDEWFAQLTTLRDLDRLMEMLEERAAEGAPLPESKLALVTERLEFVARGASGGRRPDLLARARMCAADLGLRPASLEPSPADNPWSLPHLVQALRRLPARKLERYLAFLDAQDAARTRTLLLDMLPQLDLGPFSAAMEFLRAHGHENDCIECLRGWMARQEIGVVAMAWLYRNLDLAVEWNIGSPADLGRRALDLAEESFSGELLKAQKQLKERFGKPETLRRILADMSESQRRDFIARLRRSPGWTPLDRQAMLGLLVRLCPEYEALVASDTTAPSSKTPAFVTCALTSTRSYAERQAQLRRLIEVEIPKNSREIGHARGYGDLSENFEYKAAKDMQAILMRRRGELERQLRETQPTDFNNIISDRVVPGVGVELRRADGRVERYHILGAWDRDETLNIISSESQLARAIMGRAVGETVALPDDGAGPAVIERILPLPESVLLWARGADSEAGST